MTTVTLYTRAGCCLCDEAFSVLQRVKLDKDFKLIEKDIAQNDELERAYFDRIPVVAVDGEEIFEFVVDEWRLRELLG